MTRTAAGRVPQSLGALRLGLQPVARRSELDQAPGSARCGPALEGVDPPLQLAVWVPEMVLTAVDLLLRRWSELATIRR